MIRKFFKFAIVCLACHIAIACSEQDYYEWIEPNEEEAGGSSSNNPKPDPEKPNPNPEKPNPEKPNPEKPSGYAGRIEIPQLKGGEMNIFHTWIAKDEKNQNKTVINYSYEYDCTKKHTRWVAFTFDQRSCQNNVKRTNKWKVDTNIPQKYRTDKSDYNPTYTRGHLVASGDRVASEGENEQTFYYSNMSPQDETGFNTGGGVWNNLEDQIQAWGTIKNASDTLYVVKGGTIDAPEHIREWTKSHVAVPKYYFMAILSYKNKQYKGVAFWVEHKSQKTKNMRQFAMSIRDLENKTKINFFHNLDDQIEEKVETHYSESDWSWLN